MDYKIIANVLNVRLNRFHRNSDEPVVPMNFIVFPHIQIALGIKYRPVIDCEKHTDWFRHIND